MKWLRWIALAIASVAVILFVFRGPLVERVLVAAARRAMTADPIAELPDGIHVALCGAGSPLPDPNRSGPCVGIVAGGALFVVDTGSGASRNLQRVGMPPANIRAVLLTHFHSDHIDGLGEVALQRWVGGTFATPLPLIGPTGLGEIADGFEGAYRLDKGYRIAHHGEDVAPSSGFGFERRPFDPPQPGASQVVWDADGVVITAFRVDHDPVDPAVGYRFDYAGRSVVLSGDTVKSDEVVRMSQGVDLLVHEALAAHLVQILSDAAAETGMTARAKITSDILDYHTTPVEAAQIAEGSGVGHLLFYHIVPPLIVPGMAASFVDGVAETFSGDFTLGTDGTRVSLPAGTDAIEVSAG